MTNILESLKQTWGKLSRPVQIGAGIFVLGVFISLVLLALFSRPDYQVLFAGLAPEDAGAVVSALQERGTSYRLAENGTAILVPQAEVFDTRIALATAGMPTGGVVGFEIFNATRLGETEADRQLRFQWALQGELTRTIRQINEIADARVHIVLPKRSLFLQDSQASTASVLLQLRPGSQLIQSQVRAIANLVASSVEGLTPENVSIIDTRGNVLNALDPIGLSMDHLSQRFELEWRYERQLENSIVAMLEQIYGFGNVVARVNASLDFDEFEEYSEIFSPVSRDEGLVRSEQSLEEIYSGTTTSAGGVPGVDSNIPGYVFADQGSGTSEWERREETINYEMNRTESRFKVTPGQVISLSVSVWLNGTFGPPQLATVEESVSKAIGLSTTRGDSIYVASVPFETSPFLTDTLPPDGVKDASIYWIAAIALLVLIGGIFLFIVARRSKKPAALPAAGLELLPTPEADDLPTLTPEEQKLINIRRDLQKLAKEKPEEMALLMKTWLADE